MNFGTASNVADLSLYEDRGIDGLEGFDRLFGLTYVLLERQLGSIEDDGIKPSLCCHNGFRQSVCVIGVKENRVVEFFPRASHQGRNLTNACELSLALGHPYQHRDVQFLRGCEHGLQRSQIRDVEMADRHAAFLRPIQSIPQTVHVISPFRNLFRGASHR